MFTLTLTDLTVICERTINAHMLSFNQCISPTGLGPGPGPAPRKRKMEDDHQVSGIKGGGEK